MSVHCELGFPIVGPASLVLHSLHGYRERSKVFCDRSSGISGQSHRTERNEVCFQLRTRLLSSKTGQGARSEKPMSQTVYFENYLMEMAKKKKKSFIPHSVRNKQSMCAEKYLYDEHEKL
jgi:hypothetical protein